MRVGELFLEAASTAAFRRGWFVPGTIAVRLLNFLTGRVEETSARWRQVCPNTRRSLFQVLSEREGQESLPQLAYGFGL